MPEKSFTLTVNYDHKTGDLSVNYNDGTNVEHYDAKTVEDINKALASCVEAAASKEEPEA